MAKSKMTPKKPPHDIENDKYRYVLAVTDNLRLELKSVHEKDGKVYVYEYTDEYNPGGYLSTKFGKELSLPIEQLEDMLQKEIFKVVEKPAESFMGIIPAIKAAAGEPIVLPKNPFTIEDVFKDAYKQPD